MYWLPLPFNCGLISFQLRSSPIALSSHEMPCHRSVSQMAAENQAGAANQTAGGLVDGIGAGTTYEAAVSLSTTSSHTPLLSQSCSAPFIVEMTSSWPVR